MEENRKEFKFLISLDKINEIERELDDRLLVDSLASVDGCYPIVTGYFETPNRDCYWEKERKLASRRKIRVRIYGSKSGKIPPTSFIEIKHKHYGLGAKRRLFIDLEDAIKFSTGDYTILDQCLASSEQRSKRLIINELLDLVHNRSYRPAIQMRYDRKALMSPDGQLRITYDHALFCRSNLLPLLPDDQRFETPFVPKKEGILEVKSVGPVPYWFREYLAEKSLIPRSFSKFRTALRAADPIIRSQLQIENLQT